MWRIISRQLTDNLPLKQIASGLISELPNVFYLNFFPSQINIISPIKQSSYRKRKKPSCGHC